MTELILLRGLDIGLVGFFAFQTSKIQNKKKRPGQCLVFSVEKKNHFDDKEFIIQPKY